MQDSLIVIVARRYQKLTDDVTVMIHLRMVIQLFRPHFVIIPGRCQSCESSGVVMTKSVNNRMYPILVCLRYLGFRRVLEMYTPVYIGKPEMCTSRYTHCRALLPPRQKCTPAKTLCRRGFFCWRYPDGQFEEGRADEALCRQRGRWRRSNAKIVVRWRQVISWI